MLVNFEYFETRLNLDWLTQRNSGKSIKHEPANHSNSEAPNTSEGRGKSSEAVQQVAEQVPDRFIPHPNFHQGKVFSRNFGSSDAEANENW